MTTLDDVRGDVEASVNEPDYVAVSTLWLALLKLANTGPERNEGDRMVALVQQLPADEARAILNLPAVDPLLDLDPPLDTILARHERGDPEAVQEAVDSVRARRMSNPSAALKSLGYVLKRIRNKRDHAFKRRHGERDALILGAARSVLEAFCRSALAHADATGWPGHT